MLFLNNTQAQQVEIGKATDAGDVITADTALLNKAIGKTILGGLQVTGLRIESVGAFHYLVAEGIYRNFSKTAALVLRYDIRTRTYYAFSGDGYVTCTNAACSACSLFKERGKIVGCKCPEKSTISNQCNFTQVAKSSFYLNLTRIRK